jgi:cytidylate kinase
LGLEFYSAGELFRREAERRGVDLATLSRMAENDEEIDRALDQQMLLLARPGRLLEGRITGALCRRAHRSVLYGVITANDQVRYQRLADRDHMSFDEARRLTKAREDSERRRYARLYGIDLLHEPADLTIDSTAIPLPVVVDRIVEYVPTHRIGTPRWSEKAVRASGRP